MRLNSPLGACASTQPAGLCCRDSWMRTRISSMRVVARTSSSSAWAGRPISRSPPAVDIVTTFLGAHVVPPEFAGDPDGYVTRLVEEMIPAVADEDLAEFCDVFCDAGAFTREQARIVLEAGADVGLSPKIHTHKLSDLGGALLAAEV